MSNLLVSRRPNLIKLPTVGFAGRYRIQVRRHGLPHYDSGWFDNLITDVGLEAMGGALPVARYCVVGTGNTEPVFATVNLDAPTDIVDFATSLLSTESRGIVTTGARYGWSRQTYGFPQGAVLGNIAEVGVGWTNALDTPLYSRSLISPAITLISIDQLSVTYELRMYLPTVDVVGTAIDIGGLIYAFVVRPINANSNFFAGTQSAGWVCKILSNAPNVWIVAGDPFKGTFGYRAPCFIASVDGSITTTGGVNATFDWADDYSNSGYIASSKQGKFSGKFGINKANWAEGVQGFMFSGTYGTYQCILDASVPKDNTKELTLNWQMSWARRF